MATCRKLGDAGFGKLVVISHKRCWQYNAQNSEFVTDGGFPFQITALSELFDETTLLLPVRQTPPPLGAKILAGHNLHVCPVLEPSGTDLNRKIALLSWLTRYLPLIWREFNWADAVHALAPGDIGFIGILVAFLQRKPLFVRHCGTWDEPMTLADRVLLWLLKRIAGGRNVVLATGGSSEPPCPRNPSIQWIFSTTLSEDEWANIKVAPLWKQGQRLRLVTVGRLSLAKNTATAIQALALVRRQYADTTLDVVGDGPCALELKALAASLNLTEAVTFHGNVSHAQVLDLLSQSNLFVFPTRLKEGFPKAVLEALACGLPVIATGVSVIPHLIGDKNGVVLKQTDPATIAKAVLDLAADKPRFTRMAANARQASRDYTLERWRDEIGGHLQAAWGPLKSRP
jgi:glycosyltransferase involved in cell wall biosynthesis